MTTSNACTALLVFVSIVSGTHHSQANDLAVSPKVRPKRMGVHSTFIRLSDQSRPSIRTELRPDVGVAVLEYGERIDRVEMGSPAHRAGLERGDVIIATYVSRERHGLRHPIRSRDQLRNAIQFSRDTVKLLVRNVRNGRDQQITIRFGQSQGGPRPLFKIQN